MGHAQSGETILKERKKDLSLCLQLKLKYFNFCEIFLQQNQSYFLVKSLGHVTKIKNVLQNGRPTALSGLKKTGISIILKTRIKGLKLVFPCDRFSLQTGD